MSKQEWALRKEYGHIDFGPFQDCFHGKIRPTDIDFAVESAGQFLFIDFKHGDPRPLSAGQRIFFERLTGLSNNVTAVVVYGDDKSHNYTHSMTIRNGLCEPVKETSLEKLQGWMRVWDRRTLIRTAA